MNYLFRKFLFFIATTVVIFLVSVFYSAQNVEASHCENPGINTGSDGSPGALWLKTFEANGSPVNVGWTITSTPNVYSVVSLNPFGNNRVYHNSNSFTTGDDIRCDGSNLAVENAVTGSHTGESILAGGSTGQLGGGNGWVLWCQQVDSTGAYYYDNSKSPPVPYTAYFTISVNNLRNNGGYWFLTYASQPGGGGSWNNNFWVGNGYTTQFDLKWIDPLPAPQGTIQGYKVIMPGNQAIDPANFQFVWLDAGSPSTQSNPYVFQNVPAGNHSVHVSIPPGYGAGYTLCYNATDCHNNSPNAPNYAQCNATTCAEAWISVSVPDGGYADLWWHFTPKGRLLGRVFVDPNANGVLDSGEKSIRDPQADPQFPESSCNNFQTIEGFQVNIAGPESRSAQTVYCANNPVANDFAPYWDAGEFVQGNYNVWVTPITGWKATGASNLAPGWNVDPTTKAVNGHIRATDTTYWHHVWFGVGKLPSCTITATPQTIPLGGTTRIQWTSQDADRAFIGNVTSQPDETLTSGNELQSPTATTIIVIRVENAVGSNICFATVIVTQPLPSCTISATPSTINAGDQTTITWTSQNATSATLEVSGTGAIVPIPLNGSSVHSPNVTTTYILTVTNGRGEGTCSATVTVNAASPPPEIPPLPSAPPIPPEAYKPRPNPCEDSVETAKLTDNYITEETGEAPRTKDIQATGTLGQTVTIFVQESFEVDFSQLQALFGYTNSDYLEGDYLKDSHRNANLFGFKPKELNEYHGPVQKTSVKTMADELKRTYVSYVYNKPTIAESADTFADVKGQNPLTIAELVTAYGLPNPPHAGSDRTEWLSTWGKYWEKIPTAYNELYQGKLEFAVTVGEEQYSQLQEGKACAPYVARTVRFNVPDFGRTTLVTDVLNQTIVPYQAQSFRDHRTDTQGVGRATAKNNQNVLGKVVDFCKKVIVSYPGDFVKNLKKAVKTSYNFLVPVKNAHAQEPNEPQEPPAPQTGCYKIVPPGKEGIAPYCALPPNQLQPGDFCANKVSENKLNADNTNVVCTLKVTWFLEHPIDPNDKFWDSCTLDGTTYTCSAKLRVFPNFRIPWLAEIWNNTLYSDAQEGGTGLVQGTKSPPNEGQVLSSHEKDSSINSPQVTGRPGIYSFFLPKILQKYISARASGGIELTRAEVDQLTKDCARSGSANPDNLLDNASCKKLLELYDQLSKGVPKAQNCDPSPRPIDLLRCFGYVYFKLQDSGKYLAGQSLDEGGTALGSRERFIGATDCSKQYARDLALKPEALQDYLNISQSCELFAKQAITTPSGGPSECGSTGFDQLMPASIPASVGPVSPLLFNRLNDGVIINAAKNAAGAGTPGVVPCEVLIGIHYIEGSWGSNQSFISGRTIGTAEPDVRSASACTSYGGIMTTGGCVFPDLQSTAAYAHELIKGKVSILTGEFRPPANFAELVGAFSYYNGGGNANCGEGVPYTGPCPPPTGIDDPYALNHFDSEHARMYLIYCADFTKCNPPKLLARDGAATAAKEFFVNYKKP